MVRNVGGLALVVGLALAFALTSGAQLAVTVWGDSTATARVKEVLQVLLMVEAVALGVAGAWWVASP